EMEVYLLRVAEPNAKGLQPTATPKSFSARSGPGQIEGINIKPDFLCQSLENRLGKPVVDESSLSGGFDLQLTWESDGRDDLNPAGLMKALREQLGLELVLAKRAVEVVVVEKARQQSKSPTSKRLD
ncbi:MAG: TIGR03435 family protein, partial [Verrucomicrobia bacterium]|nr:TIGR03435 family protein [Verrucomicrobiota bacterium]